MTSSAELFATAPYLDVANPTFSIRSPEVMAAREKSWFARTPYGIAVLRYDEVNKLLRDLHLRQGSYAWPALANPAFSPKLVKQMVPRFQELANALIDDFIEDGRCEFVHQNFPIWPQKWGKRWA